MTVANGASSAPVGGMIIEGRDLVRSFGETPALRGASLSVQRGEIVAVMGERLGQVDPPALPGGHPDPGRR